MRVVSEVTAAWLFTLGRKVLEEALLLRNAEIVGNASGVNAGVGKIEKQVFVLQVLRPQSAAEAVRAPLDTTDTGADPQFWVELGRAARVERSVTPRYFFKTE
ncbi:uncharacterized [Tachysurus ichikawai]